MKQHIQLACLFAVMAGLAFSQQKGDILPALVWDQLKNKSSRPQLEVFARETGDCFHGRR